MGCTITYMGICAYVCLGKHKHLPAQTAVTSGVHTSETATIPTRWLQPTAGSSGITNAFVSSFALHFGIVYIVFSISCHHIAVYACVTVSPSSADSKRLLASVIKASATTTGVCCVAIHRHQWLNRTTVHHSFITLARLLCESVQPLITIRPQVPSYVQYVTYFINTSSSYQPCSRLD